MAKKSFLMQQRKRLLTQNIIEKIGIVLAGRLQMIPVASLTGICVGDGFESVNVVSGTADFADSVSTPSPSNALTLCTFEGIPVKKHIEALDSGTENCSGEGIDYIEAVGIACAGNDNKAADSTGDGRITLSLCAALYALECRREGEERNSVHAYAYIYMHIPAYEYIPMHIRAYACILHIH